MLHIALAMIAAYLLGAIPFGYLIVRFAQGKDIRQVGSGNIGATNVLRSGKKWQGVLTLLLDGGKGYLSVCVARWLLGPDAWTWMTLAAFLAVFGHIFTVFLRFKGGKGVATGCGAYLALTPHAVITTLVLFALVVATTRYVSLGSILATGLFPLWGFLWGEGTGHMVVIWGSIPGALLIISRHADNIRRLLRGEERKIGQKKKDGETGGKGPNVEHRTSNAEHRTANGTPQSDHSPQRHKEHREDLRVSIRNPQSEFGVGRRPRSEVRSPSTRKNDADTQRVAGHPGVPGVQDAGASDRRRTGAEVPRLQAGVPHPG